MERPAEGVVIGRKQKTLRGNAAMVSRKLAINTFGSTDWRIGSVGGGGGGWGGEGGGGWRGGGWGGWKKNSRKMVVQQMLHGGEPARFRDAVQQQMTSDRRDVDSPAEMLLTEVQLG